MGMRYGNNTNTRFVDSYQTLDAMASYQFNRHLDLRFNLSNVNNAYYFEPAGRWAPHSRRRTIRAGDDEFPLLMLLHIDSVLTAAEAANCRRLGTSRMGGWPGHRRISIGADQTQHAVA
jgi:hypothetical protein